ncbi:MAG: hypothetical protein AB1668_01035 [Nanoarchaeota archaeon]
MEERVKFFRNYANVPDTLRRDILVVVDKKPYTWDTAYLEVKDNTPHSTLSLKNCNP